MYRESLFVIIFFYTKTVVGRMIGEHKEETTQKPMLITGLTFDVWCKFQTNTYDCGEHGRHAYRFYYDTLNEGCKATHIGDCDNNLNNFYDLRECNDICREPGKRVVPEVLTPNVYCRMQPDFGLCSNYHPMWYFDISTRTCKGFSYSGCGGNQNKFGNIQDCTMTCLPNIEYRDW
ncbi:thrombin inhibitor hemalin-like [Plodia interpunctella]|uniref:thrombin inhibitor hemalin-like n=1 Tax=Plodia interpunctella TaxID=58824 RepID=UPI002367945E|nr:thrombin inhibitor hemalin-like isoform X2 [Plodia interpunctella]XP_053624662.1 thrombin inhibitor hemalin-like isoform X2 [Plodia interpunctella]XP_053624663.1 thrombin inhibitor hemalin-like isoform X2 [Plodia interpunctella]